MASNILGQQAPNTGSAVAASANAVAAGTTIPSVAPSYEWIYPNSSDGKYFTATQAQIYIGNLFIDELNALQFAFQGNRIPVFGYCSEEADAFGTGRRLVQGQIAINFVTEGYLYTVLNEYKNLNSPQNTSPYSQNAAQLASLVTQRQQIASQQSSIGSNGTASATSASALQSQLAAIDSQIQALAASGGPDVIAAAKQASVVSPVKNAIACSVKFDIHCVLTGAGRTVERVLRKCMLTSNEQVYDQSGQTLLDTYGFIAKSCN